MTKVQPGASQPLEVAYDISHLGWMHDDPSGKRGISRVVENVCNALLEHPACRLTLTAAENSLAAERYLAQRSDNPNFASVPRDYPLHRGWSRAMSGTHRFHRLIQHGKRSLPRRAAGRALRDLLSAQLRLATRLRAFDPEQFDIFHSPAFMPLPAYVRQAKRPARFLTVYDLIPIHFPHMSGDAVTLLRKAVASVGREDFMICISQHVKDDVCQHFQRNPERVFVAPLAASPQYFHPCADPERLQSIRQRCGVPEGPYLLSLCTVEERKNLRHLIHCFARMTQEHPAEEVSLVLVGSVSPMDVPRFEEMIADHRLQGRVRLTGFVADSDLAALYSGARAFVFPSLAEGFGLPPLEAMQCGIPVISSNRTSLPEVVGDAGILIDPEDADALCQAMHNVLRDSVLHAELSRRSLARAARFSWERCAQDHVNAYAKARAMQG